MGPHMRHKGTHAVDHSHQVDIQNPAPVVERAAPTPDPGVVAQDVDFAEGRKGCFGSGVDGSGIGDIADNAPYFRPGAREARHRRIQRSLLYIGEHNLAARFAKSTAQRQPNATRATSHKSSFANELPHHLPSPWM